ncbi:MAG: hypothetical protein NTY50_03110 [Methylobacter sp.]|nr:hypothetical protein [Methylobacter sp.]
MSLKFNNLILISVITFGLALGLNLFFNKQSHQPVNKINNRKTPLIASPVIFNNHSKTTLLETEDKSQPQVIYPTTDEQRYQKTLYLLDAFRQGKSNELLSKQNLAILARCSSCQTLLRNELLLSVVSGKNLSRLANGLTLNNHAPLAKILVEVASEISKQSDNKEHLVILSQAISQFNSPKIADFFTDYLLNNQDIPFELLDALPRSINASSQRIQIAESITKRFQETTEPETQDKLLAIDHPEALVKITQLALEQDDKDLYDKTIERIKSNPSKYTFNVLRSMLKTQANNEAQTESVQELAKQWANRQLSGNRLDFVEAQLVKDSLSEEEKMLVLNMLENSEDKTRGQEIITKFQENFDGLKQ